ncbi:MAG TPA: DUF2971 domain-containing protein [Gallionella sp.]|nr:DUF2971 domain-containing protein [Gallionella sp.]
MDAKDNPMQPELGMRFMNALLPTDLPRHEIRYLLSTWARPTRLVHYTTPLGLMGIVSQRGFWMTDARFLNDISEVEHGLQYIAGLLHNLLKKKRYSCFTRILRRAAEKLPDFAKNRYYIACFSLEADLLEQWRAYGDNGSGVAIEFDVTVGLLPFWAMPIISLHKVLYTDAEKNKVLLAVIRRFAREYKRDLSEIADAKEMDETAVYLKKHPDELDQPYGEYLASALQAYAFCFKDKAFSSEREVRMVFQEGNAGVMERFTKINFREAGGVLTPYVCSYELKANTSPEPLPISRIIIGPAARKNISEAGIQSFIAAHGYDPSIVLRSPLPYRT